VGVHKQTNTWTSLGFSRKLLNTKCGAGFNHECFCQIGKAPNSRTKRRTNYNLYHHCSSAIFMWRRLYQAHDILYILFICLKERVTSQVNVMTFCKHQGGCIASKSNLYNLGAKKTWCSHSIFAYSLKVDQRWQAKCSIVESVQMHKTEMIVQ